MPDQVVAAVGVVTVVGFIVTIVTLIQSILDWKAISRSGENGAARDLVRSDMILASFGLVQVSLILVVIAISLFAARPLPIPLRLTILYCLVGALVLATALRVYSMYRRKKLGYVVFPWWGRDRR